MSEELRLELLGGLALSRANTPVTGFASAKAPALLCYLAVDPRSHSRESLASLLWSESREEDARASLRVALSNLRRVVGREYLLTNRTTVAFSRDSHYWLDVEQFETGLRHDGLDADLAAESTRRTVDLYRGDLLAGIVLNDAPVFEEWLATRREYLRQMAVEALERLAEQETRVGNGTASIGYLKRLLELDPWREDAHRQLMEALVADGRRGAALIQYQDCRRLLATELQVKPEPATTRLFERIRDGELTVSVPFDEESDESGHSWTPAAPPVQLLPSAAPHTSFVGREQELAHIVANLVDPDCRLITLAGSGGIGKTRLALRVMDDRRIGFRNGLCYVPLAPVDRPEFLAAAIAEAAGVSLNGREPPAGQLLRFLRDREMLLVLDNFEHLMDGATLVNEILDAAPAVKLLVTSRERLALRSEWLLPISGLPVHPDGATDESGTEGAVRLFSERARQVRPDFHLASEDSECVARICALLNGQPLGIELAAAWASTHSCAEIEARMAGDLDFLMSPMRDIPERHRSLRAVFMQTWSLLSPAEQTVFRAVSVFRGGFDLRAAEMVAGASQADLMSLVDKYLLYRDGAGRYTAHELTRQYAIEQLESSAGAVRAHRRHAVYFADLLENSYPALRGADQQEALQTIAAELDNVRAAWQWALAHHELSILARALNGLQLFTDLTGRVPEGRQALEQAVAAIELTQSNSDEHARERDVLHGRLLGWLGRHAMSLGHFADSEMMIAQSLTVLAHHGAEHELALGMDTRAMNANARGHQDEALRLQQAALAEAQAGNDWLRMGLAYRGMGGIAFNAGRFEAARSWFDESVRVRQELRDWEGAAREIGRLAEVARLMGEYAESRRQWEESLALLRELGGRFRTTFPLTSLGELCLDQGLLDEAEQHFTEAREIAVETDSQRSWVLIMHGLAAVKGYRGDLDGAIELVDEAETMARSNGFLLGIMHCLDLQAWLAMQAADWQRARSLAGQTLSMATEAGNEYEVGRAEVTLGLAATEVGDFTNAEQLLGTAYARLSRTGARPAILDALASMARLFAAIAGDGGSAYFTGSSHRRRELTVELLSLITQDPAAWFETRARADDLIVQLAGHLPRSAFEAARARAGLRTPDVILDLNRVTFPTT